MISLKTVLFQPCEQLCENTGVHIARSLDILKNPVVLNFLLIERIFLKELCKAPLVACLVTLINLDCNY